MLFNTWEKRLKLGRFFESGNGLKNVMFYRKNDNSGHIIKIYNSSLNDIAANEYINGKIFLKKFNEDNPKYSIESRLNASNLSFEFTEIIYILSRFDLDGHFPNNASHLLEYIQKYSRISANENQQCNSNSLDGYRLNYLYSLEKFTKDTLCIDKNINDILFCTIYNSIKEPSELCRISLIHGDLMPKNMGKFCDGNIFSGLLVFDFEDSFIGDIIYDISYWFTSWININSFDERRFDTELNKVINCFFVKFPESSLNKQGFLEIFWAYFYLISFMKEKYHINALDEKVGYSQMRTAFALSELKKTLYK